MPVQVRARLELDLDSDRLRPRAGARLRDSRARKATLCANGQLSVALDACEFLNLL